jgi:hypothetical protein
MRTRAFAGVALALSLSAYTAPGADAAPKAAVPNNQNAKQKNAQTGHAHHLLKAEEQLVEAESALVAQNAGKAQKHVTAALRQVQEAVAHHHKHHVATARPSGFGGTFQAGKHHRHHATLKQAESELIAAEKALVAGNAAQASKDVARAAKTIKNAVASHRHLFGKA